MGCTCMIKAAKLRWAGAETGKEQGWSRSRTTKDRTWKGRSREGQERGIIRNMVGVRQEQDRSR